MHREHYAPIKPTPRWQTAALWVFTLSIFAGWGVVLALGV